MERNNNTEQKIKEAARVVFTRKGFAATRTRDIAEESGFNLALINYYFRSKQQLFEMVMIEHIQLFFHSILGLLNDPDTDFEEKLEHLAGHYIDMLIKNPDLPVFVLGEIRSDAEAFMYKVMGRERLPQVPLIFTQWQQYCIAHEIKPVNPIHFMINFLSLIIFPFAAGPIIRNRAGMDMEQYHTLMQQRKKLIPQWIKMMMLQESETPNHENNG